MLFLWASVIFRLYIFITIFIIVTMTITFINLMDLLYLDLVTMELERNPANGTFL